MADHVSSVWYGLGCGSIPEIGYLAKPVSFRTRVNAANSSLRINKPCIMPLRPLAFLTAWRPLASHRVEP